MILGWRGSTATKARSLISTCATTAIFVIEDDAQDGPDHVDAHRTVCLVASPFARRGLVDHTLYSTASMLRTIELILGMPPMSQFDAAATPMTVAFGDSPDRAPYEALTPRQSLNEVNSKTAYRAQDSLTLALERADAACDQGPRRPDAVS